MPIDPLFERWHGHIDAKCHKELTTVLDLLPTQLQHAQKTLGSVVVVPPIAKPEERLEFLQNSLFGQVVLATPEQLKPFFDNAKHFETHASTFSEALASECRDTIEKAAFWTDTSDYVLPEFTAAVRALWKAVSADATLENRSFRYVAYFATLLTIKK